MASPMSASAAPATTFTATFLAASVLVAGAVALDAPRHIDGREHVDLEVHLGLLSIASFPHG
eukprot:COSAG01_NODE_1231_length_11111_cov_37.001816_8_plen_62_part_00